MPKLDFKVKTKTDVDRFYEQNLNIKLPIDGPLWRFYC